MSNLLNYGDIEADYVLTEEEEKTLRSEESQAEIQQNVDQLRTEQIQQQAEAQAAEQAALRKVNNRNNNLLLLLRKSLLIQAKITPTMPHEV
jgi:chromosome condensin MukBEF complex kleisin-like MukF subunit